MDRLNVVLDDAPLLFDLEKVAATQVIFWPENEGFPMFTQAISTVVWLRHRNCCGPAMQSSPSWKLPGVDVYYLPVLELDGNATLADVQRKYRQLAAQYHPAKVQHLGQKRQQLASEEMRKINEASEFLRNRLHSA